MRLARSMTQSVRNQYLCHSGPRNLLSHLGRCSVKSRFSPDRCIISSPIHGPPKSPMFSTLSPLTLTSATQILILQTGSSRSHDPLSKLTRCPVSQPLCLPQPSHDPLPRATLSPIGFNQGLISVPLPILNSRLFVRSMHRLWILRPSNQWSWSSSSPHQLLSFLSENRICYIQSAFVWVSKKNHQKIFKLLPWPRTGEAELT
jgi:hypothetical protein